MKNRLLIAATLAALSLFAAPDMRAASATDALAAGAPAAAAGERFASYVPRNGHVRPLIAVIGDNAGTELTDFVAPYAVLQRSGAVELLAVATRPGPMKMRPALRLRPDTDFDGFDAWHPEGADYVIVPALVKQDEPRMLAWLRAQHAKGATIVSICDGALVVADAGLLEGRRATAHWATDGHRRKTWPGTQWLSDARYVVDGDIASSAGISAAMPVSLALVEAIAGRDRAAEVAATLGVSDWGTAHDSAAFGLRPGNLWPIFQVNLGNHWFRRQQRFDIALRPGMDDLALAITADGWARTGRATVRGVATAAEVQGDSGLLWFADDRPSAGRDAPLEPLRAAAHATVFDAVLAAIDRRFGPTTARGVALDFEYAWRP
ncbi:MAG TPA: DJ-1/PfpI family protein [Luteimonas sp.]|jgi:putative intracellular protease/amidase|nr:DJ-1/PfpI family protein [Luteimonas sp.]